MVDKVTVPVSELELIDKVNELIDDKQDTLVSGVNIKTINNINILGSGNIDVSGGGSTVTPTWGNIAGTLSDQTDLKDALDDKYDANNPDGYQANVIETIKVNGTVQTVTTKTVDISIPAAPTVDQTYNASSTNAQSGTAVAGALTTKVSKTGDTMTGTLEVTGTYGTVSAQGGAFSIDGNYEGFIYQFYIDETGACLYHGSETITLTSGSFYTHVEGDIDLDADGEAFLTGSNVEVEATNGTVTITASNGDVVINSPHLYLTSITETYTTIPDQTAITAKWLKDNAMPLKQDVLVSGTNIKTINGNSILGSGNITISGGGGTWGSITGTLSDQTDLQDALDDKVEYAMVIVDYTGD